MPQSTDVLRSRTSDYNVPMSFRRERYWFLSFLMTPFKDIEPRTIDDRPSPQGARRGR